jgi:hypothetical protein
MSTRRAPIVALSLSLVVAGCGGGAPRIDASTDETARASLDRMRAGLSKAQRDALAGDISTVAMPAMIKRALASRNMSEGPAVSLKPIDGLTAAEIHEKAEAIRKGRGGGAATK